MRRFLAISTACMLLHHVVLWAVVISTHGLTWAGALANWDSNWYEQIIHRGYGGNAWAFYPLYPAVVAAASFVVPIATPILGSLLSTAALLGFVWLIAGREGRAAGLVPETKLGWFFFLYSPATYTFHSHHTEGIYLLMSAAALLLAAEKRWLWASVLAGLCALTKNQGVFLAVAIAAAGAWQVEGWGKRARVFALSGLVSGGIWGLFPLYAYLRDGDPLAFAHAQEAWRAEISLSSYVRALWFGNPWQNTNSGSVMRHALFVILAVSVPFVWRKRKEVGLYAALFVGIMPLPGEFVGCFRYAAVLFPIWFLLGDNASRKLPRWAVAAICFFMIWLNHDQTRRYILLKWAY